MIFENFIYHTLFDVRKDPLTANKQIVIFMDNATIHKVPIIYKTARKMKVSIMLNASYLPWLNPIEQLFNAIKRELHRKDSLPTK